MREEDLKERYRRQLILEEVGETGQNKLKNAKVLIIGVGGLGSPIALYLAGVGIGEIGLIDNDCVSLSNLQRQIIHNSDDLSKLKVNSAKAKLEKLNCNVKINTYPIELRKG